MSTEPRMTIEQLAQKCDDAFSTDRYRDGWKGSVRALRVRGYSDRQIEAIIRSKHTRWAADASSNNYGRVTGSDLGTYIDRQRERLGKRRWDKEVADLVDGTFGE